MGGVVTGANEVPGGSMPWLQALSHPAWVVGLPACRVVAVNAAARALLGPTERDWVGQTAQDLAASPEDLAYWSAAGLDTSGGTGSAGRLQSDVLLALPGGRMAYGTRSIEPLCLPGAPDQVLLVFVDRSDDREQEQQREARLLDLQATLEATADGIAVTDPGGRVQVFNRRFAELWGLPADLLSRRDDAAIQAWMTRTVIDPQAYSRRLHALLQASQIVATDRLQLHSGLVMERVSRPLMRFGLPQGRVWSFRDLSEQIAAQARIETLSLHDPLTGLRNRHALATRVAQATELVRRGEASFALLVIDLDRFRHINDTLGQDVGDQVLLGVVQRIQACLRPGDLLARLGGDQFALVADSVDATAAEAMARRILNVVAQPCDVDGAQFTLTCSIGVAVAPAHGWNADDLVRHAESAMRQAKAGGRANHRLHQTRSDCDRRSHMKLDHLMRQALVSGRFRLHYQPQVSVVDARILGAEALLRWRDPELGEVGPQQFIPVAEDSGFIVDIGQWVLGQAVRQAAMWMQRGHALPVAINVSALQFQQAQFVDQVASVLAISGLPPSLLELELTESILVHEAHEALLRLQALARLGVRLSIDDFGTGYSSLSYLKRFPIGKLKIDRSFVSGLPADDSDAGIVRAILQMARALDLKVIAEGVETEAQRRFLQEAGCDEYQGYLFAPALDALSFEQRLPKPSPPEANRAVPRMRLVGS